MSPCNRCRPSGLVCKVSRDSKRCGNCVRRGYTDCDAKVISGDAFDRVDRERARLDEAWNKERDRLRAAALEQRQALEKMERLERLRSFLDKREGEMIRRGVDSVEELEAIETEERLGQGASNVAVSSGDGSAGGSLEDFVLGSWTPSSLDWGFVGDIVVPTAGTS